MKKTVLALILCVGACSQAADNSGWVKKVKSYGTSGITSIGGCCIMTGSGSAYSETTYQYFVGHKLVSYISKDSDDLYNLYNWKKELIGVYDDLTAAKAEGAKLDK